MLELCLQGIRQRHVSYWRSSHTSYPDLWIRNLTSTCRVASWHGVQPRTDGLGTCKKRKKGRGTDLPELVLVRRGLKEVGEGGVACREPRSAARRPPKSPVSCCGAARCPPTSCCGVARCPPVLPALCHGAARRPPESPKPCHGAAWCPPESPKSCRGVAWCPPELPALCHGVARRPPMLPMSCHGVARWPPMSPAPCRGAARWPSVSPVSCRGVACCPPVSPASCHGAVSHQSCGWLASPRCRGGCECL